MNISIFGISEKFLFWNLMLEEKRQKCNHLSVSQAIYILKKMIIYCFGLQLSQSMPRLTQGYYSPRVAFPDNTTSSPRGLFRLSSFLRHHNVLVRVLFHLSGLPGQCVVT